MAGKGHPDGMKMGSLQTLFSHQCLEEASLLKNPLGAHIHLRLGTNHTGFGAFGA
jgi:hypothetical protein